MFLSFFFYLCMRFPSVSLFSLILSLEERRGWRGGGGGAVTEGGEGEREGGDA